MDLARGSILSLFYRVTGLAFVMAVGIVIAHGLSDEDRGIYVSVAAVITAVGSVAGSFASASGYFVSNQKRDAAEVAANSALLALAMGLLFAALVLVAWMLYDGEHRTLLLLAGLGLPPMITRHALGGVFLGTNAIARYSFSVHGPAIIGFVLLVTWLYGFDQRTLTVALAALVASHYLSLLVMVAMGAGWWRWMVTHRPSPRLMGGMMTFGAVTGIAGFISFFNYRIDQILVLSLDSAEGAGIYPSAVFIAEGLWFLSTATAIASYASVGSLARADSADLTARAVRQTVVAVAAGAVVVFIFAPQLLRLLYPDHHAEAATALRVLCVGTALFAPQAILSNFYTVQLGKPGIALALAGMSAIINIGVSAALIPGMGYLGGAWGTTISYAIASAVSYAWFLRLSGLPLSAILRPTREDVFAYPRMAMLIFRKLRPGPARSGDAIEPGRPL